MCHIIDREESHDAVMMSDSWSQKIDATGDRQFIDRHPPKRLRQLLDRMDRQFGDRQISDTPILDQLIADFSF